MTPLRAFAAGHAISAPEPGDDGPSLRAEPIGRGSTGTATRLLTAAQRKRLAAIATVHKLPAGRVVFDQDAEAGHVFVCGEGVVKSFRQLPSGTRRMAGFLFKDDLFGLADRGAYVNTTQTVTPARIFRLPLDALTAVLRRDPELEFQFLCKVTHELRESQRRMVILGRRDAAGRLAMFLIMLRRVAPRPADVAVVPLPMSRTDIADFLALSPEAVSRAAKSLVRRGLIVFEGRHAARVVDLHGLTALASKV